MCLIYRKDDKFTSDLIRYINLCKILIALPSCQPSKSIIILGNNTTSYQTCHHMKIKKV